MGKEDQKTKEFYHRGPRKPKEEKDPVAGASEGGKAEKDPIVAQVPGSTGTPGEIKTKGTPVSQKEPPEGTPIEGDGSETPKSEKKPSEATEGGEDQPDPEGRTWPCPWCKEPYNSERSLYRHLLKCEYMPDDRVSDEKRAEEKRKGEPGFKVDIFPEGYGADGKPTAEETPGAEGFPYQCGYCEAGLATKERFCPKCGKPLRWAGE